MIHHTHSHNRRGLEDHLEEVIGRPSSSCLRRRHEREILTEFYRMKSEGKMCSERLGAVSRRSSLEECQRAAAAAAEDAIVAAQSQKTYSILNKTAGTVGAGAVSTNQNNDKTRTTTTTATTTTKTAEQTAVSFMDSLQNMVACGVGYES